MGADPVGAMGADPPGIEGAAGWASSGSLLCSAGMGTSPAGDYQRFAESMTTMPMAITPRNIVAWLRYQRSVVFIPVSCSVPLREIGQSRAEWRTNVRATPPIRA